MKIRSQMMGTMIVITLFGLAAALLPASAQDEPPRRHRLELKFSAAPTEPPSIEPAGDTAVFRINPVGTVTGDLEGSFSQRITSVDSLAMSPPNPVNYLEDIATFFTIETDDGTIEGFYYGASSFPEATYPDSIVKQHGLVIAVTAAYANLYLADVYYDGVINFEEVNGIMAGIGDSGTLIIAPR